MDKRPNFKDTQEDILRQQAEFLKNKAKPAAKLVKNDDLASRITNASIQTDEIPEKSGTGTNLIGKIIQNNINHDFPIQNMTLNTQGFPQAKRRNFTDISTKKCSLFSQQSHKKQKNDEPEKLPEKSNIVSGNDSQAIHSENLSLLAKMSESEILEEKTKLLNTLNPDLVKFLQSRRSKTDIKMDISEPGIKMDISEPGIKMDISEPDISIEDINTPKEIIDQSENWLHFDTIEVEKLQWMKNLDKPKNADQYEARFDFSGFLLPYTEEMTETNRSLYHHGEEASRPGYTLKELFKLCRSNVQQQRILALNTISNILSLNSTGIYDNIIDIPLEQIFFVVRITLDDNTPNILNASLKTMHNLVVYKIDEHCLDQIQGFGCAVSQPMLTVAQSTDDKDMNDQQLSETDLIKCLVRSDILARIRYIINTVKPSTESIIYCLEIIIRLLRDSDEIVTKVYQTEDLFQSIVHNFVPKIYKLEDSRNDCYGKPLIQALKLLRVACCRSRTIAADLVERYNIFDVILSYISNHITDTTIGVKIQVETFKLVAILFKYNLSLEHFSDFQSFLLTSLDYHLRNTSSNNNFTLQSHFSGLVLILSEVCKHNPNETLNFIPLLIQSLAKASAQVSNLTDFKCGQLQSVAAILVTLTDFVKAGSVANDNLENIVFRLISSDGFNKITENIKLGSNLLCANEPHKSSANFCTLESAIWSNSEHIIPVLSSKSCIPFLAALSYYISNSSCKLAIKLIEHPNINKYLVLLKNTSKFFLTNNWFTKYESDFVMNILKCAVNSQTLNLFLYYEVTIKCLSIFTAEQEFDIDYILQNIVFNKHFYPNEVLLQEMNISNNTDELMNVLPHLHEIYLCYANVLALKKNQTESQQNLTVDTRIGNIIPIDWIFAPIVSLYSNFEDNSTKNVNEESQTLTITRCLQWIFLYEQYFPTLSSFINITDRFCRLSCIFLSSNTLFLEKNVHKLLELCLAVLIRKDNFDKIDFSQQIQGLNNFQDFYVQLLEQYQGVSYGDILFANFVLIPLAQRHDSKWRKILWSEYLGVAQTITLDLNQCLIDINEFLQPPETDISILKCYRRALVSEQLNRSPFLKYVANFHVENYVKLKRTNQEKV